MVSDGHGGLWIGTEYMGLGHIRMRRKASVFVAPFEGVHPDANHVRATLLFRRPFFQP